MRQTKSGEDRSAEAEALQEACRREGCPLCTVVQERVAMAMNTWSYEGFTDVEHRQEVARTRGFCPQHTWQLARSNNAFQLALVYENVLDAMEHDLERGRQIMQQGTASRGWLTKIKNLFQGGSSIQRDRVQLYSRCSFCRLQANVERRLIERLVGLLRGDNMVELLRQSTGLCRVHFSQALQYATEHAPEQCAVLVAGQQECVQRVHSELREAIRKHDYRFRHEAQGEEMTAWRRAAEICAGNPGVLS